MASGTRTVKVKFDGDAKGLNRAAASGERAMSGWQRKMQGVGKGIGKIGAGIGAGLATAAKAGVAGVAILGAGLVGLGPKLYDAAANIELMGKKAATVFGNQISQVEKWAEANAHGMGLTKREAVNAAAGLGDLLIPMGFARKEAANMSTKIIGLSGALSEWSGGTRSTAEVNEILTSALLGETDSLKGLGIAISAADIEARLAKKGQEELTGAARQQAEALAIQELLFEKSTDAQKAYANGAGSMARKAQESKARLKEMGESLLVTATPALQGLGDAVIKYALPLLERFVKWVSGPGKYVIAETAVSWLSSFLTFGQGLLKFLAGVLRTVTGWASNVLSVAAKVAYGLGNKGLGDKLSKASGDVKRWGSDVARQMDNSAAKLGEWNKSVDGMRKEIQLRANIADLQTKINTAKAELKNPNLTKERRAKLSADITRLIAARKAASAELDKLKGKTVNINGFVHWQHKNLTPESRRVIIEKGKADGGPFSRGWTGWVGEEGPELVTFGSGGRVHSAPESRRIAQDAMAGSSGSGGGGVFEGNLYLDSGQLLGLVRGAIRESNRGIRRRVLSGTGGAR